MSWLSGYNYRKKITISNTYVDSDLSNFPLLVAFTNDSGIGAHMQDTTNYYDIRFTDSDESTLLKYEKESMSISGGQATGNYWVKVPTIYKTPTGDQNIIYVYYGKAGDTDGSDKNNVWDSNFKGVWHLPNGTTLTANDSLKSSTVILSKDFLI